MRLIDANKVQQKLLEECQNIRHFDKDREKPQIFADGIDFAWVMLDNQPTVKAIPIEWIVKWYRRALDNSGFMGDETISVGDLLADWEKENEKSGISN